jgi:alpha-mannosidase
MERISLRSQVFLIFFLIIFVGLAAAAPGPSARRVESVKNRHDAKLRAAGLSPTDLRVYSIGKSHIDAAFTWRLRETREHKVPYTFSQAIQHIREYPTFTYHQSSAQFYEWIKDDDPALFREIQAAEKQGRWVIVGGMWIESDGNMPDGESLVRQFLYGQRFFIENFGHGADLVWMEDSFGFNWNLPQIAKKSGANSFYTYKMLWNLRNVFPFHLFYWQAPDGSRILAHISPILSGINPSLESVFPYPEFQPNPRSDYFLNSLSTKIGVPWKIKAGYRQTRQLLKPGEQLTANYLTTPAQIYAKLSDDLLPVVGTFYGAGDGGHGPTKMEIETQLALEQSGLAKMGTTGRLFADFATYSQRLPVWNDELYLEYHQGVFATHERVKRQNREAEARMRQVESAATVARLAGAPYPSSEIKELWKMVLLNQFHDILPGTGIKEVYQDADVHFAQIQERTGELLNSSLSALADKINARPPRPNLHSLTVFNPLGWERKDLVRYAVTGGTSYRVFDQESRELPAQLARSEEGGSYLYFLPGSLPALGWKTFYLESGSPTVAGGPTVQESAETVTIENEVVRVRINRASGWMVSLFDKTLNRELLSVPGNRILAFTDQPLGYPAWNLSEDYLEKPLEVPAVNRITVTDQGPVLARVLIERRGTTSFKQWITIYRGSPVVGCITWTDLHWKDALVKVEFNTALETGKAPAEIPYAVIERSTRPTVAWDVARIEMPCSKWLDFSDGRAGLSLLNFGGHGFSITPDGRGFRMSIIKSSSYPRPEPTSLEVDRLSALRLRPDLQTDQGEHWSYLALLPHPGDWREGKVYRTGYEFNTPLLALAAPANAGPLPAEFSPIQIESPSVIITSVKQAEDDDSIIVRLVESEGADTQASLRVSLPFAIARAWETDLLELNPVPLAHDQRGLKVAVSHFEIKTIKLELSLAKGQ